MPIYPEVSESNFNPAPEGLHQAVCVDVIDLGMQPGFQQKPTHKIRIVWELGIIDPETHKRFQVRNQYSLSLHEKSNLSQHLESWRGRKFTEIERSGDPSTPDRRGRFDVEKVVGANCQLQISHTIKDGGRIWPDIQAIVPAPKDALRLECLDYVRSAKEAGTQSSNGTGESNGYPAPGDDDDDLPF